MLSKRRFSKFWTKLVSLFQSRLRGKVQFKCGAMKVISWIFAILVLELPMIGGDKAFKILPSAFKGIHKTLLQDNQEITIVNYGCDAKVFDSIFSGYKKDKPRKISNFNEKSRLQISESAIMTFDSVNSLKSFNAKVQLKNDFSKKFKFFVYCQNATVDEIASLRPSNTNILHFEYFVVDAVDAIRLLTFVWYMPGQCNVTQLIEINRFNKVTETWKKPNFVIQKFKNFYGCRLVLGILHQFPFASVRFKSGTISFDGFNIVAMYDLAESLNFTILMNPWIENRNQFFHSKVPVDLTISQYDLNHYAFVSTRSKWFFTRPYLFVRSCLALPPGKEYSVYEKLHLPFDRYTWFLIVFTFFVAYTTVFIVNRFERSVQKFVFGSRVTTPGTNILRVFFGDPQHILPGRNFARLLFMFFALYCIIMRTAYQGKMFEFMKKNITKPELQSIEDMIENNYTFCSVSLGFDSFKKVFREMDFIKRWVMAQ